MKGRIPYIDTGPLPIYLGFSRSKSAFEAEMRRLEIAEPPDFVGHGADATTYRFTNAKHMEMDLVIVCMRPSRRDVAELYGLLVHEAVHVWQFALEAMRSPSPAGEFEAYCVQFLAQRMFELARRR